MTTLAAIHARIVDALAPVGPAVVGGPPFDLPVAGPCYVVEPPIIDEVVGVAGHCRVTSATVDVVCVPPTGTDRAALLALADAAISALGPAVRSGAPEGNPYAPAYDDAYVYRLTIEE